MLFAFGPNFYFIDKWHYLDITVSTVSLLEIAIVAINQVAIALVGQTLPDSETLDTVMNTLKIIRVLRPLKAITMLPSLLEFLEGCARSFSDVFINFTFLLFSVSSLTFLVLPSGSFAPPPAASVFGLNTNVWSRLMAFAAPNSSPRVRV